MPVIGNILEASSDDLYSNNCTLDGKCSGCGECCADFLPLSEAEVKRIRNYMKSHKLNEHRANVLMVDAIDLTCPFRDSINKKCDIYSIRPEICRAFICRKSLQDAKNDRDLISEKRDIYSMRQVFFGNYKPMEKLLETMGGLGTLIGDMLPEMVDSISISYK